MTRGDRAGWANRDVRTARPRIVAFDYACDPRHGSEPGAGWEWARILARLGDTWVITRANNRAPIEASLVETPERDRLHFVYVDLPPWARFWKKGQRGVHLYYLLWQLAALRAARRLHREVSFTLAWHITFANAWFGSLAPLVGPPFVYGPVGGGVGMAPLRLVRMLGPRAVTFELARAAAQAAGRYLNPVARLAWAQARLVLVQNNETRAWLPRRHRAKVAVFPNPIIDVTLGRERPPLAPPTALFVGRLLAWKGAGLAVNAVARSPDWSLLLCGTGGDEKSVRRLVQRLGLDGRVRFLGPQTRPEVLRLMSGSADVLLFPSMREDAGWVVVEALACGLPVICLDRGGPPLLAGDAGLVASLEGGVDAVASALAGLLDLAELPSEERVHDRARHFSSTNTFARLHDLIVGIEPAVSLPAESARK
jgi:glycosyltransferase involved in cell wall biosynthesis